MGMQHGRRVIEVNRQVVGPTTPRLKTVRPRKPADYPHVSAVHLDVARRLSSPLMLGPPICDELIALVQHLFDEEEASIVRHLGLVLGRRAADLARVEHRPTEQIEAVLDRLLNIKRVIVASGPSENQRYRLLPIVPGIFEMMLVGQKLESMTPWHRRFVELFEALYETGYSLDYQEHPTPTVRYLPVGKVIDAHPRALPTDKLEAVLDRFQVFAVGQCQCRMAMQVLGRGCGKPLENCMLMGQWAQRGIETGVLKQVSKKEALNIKREAESHGLVNWMMNVESPHGQCSCSCCGCCCHAMRTVNEFSAPGLIAPPHFLPRLDPTKCTYCGKCAQNCPMGAIAVDTQGATETTSNPASPAPTRYTHLQERCIGCGLCVLACDRQRALVMEPVPDYRKPYRSWFSLIAHATPGVLRNTWKVWRQRP